MSSYFHVVVWRAPSTGAADMIFSDLTEQQLRQKFVGPYHRGDTIRVGSEFYKLAELTGAEIIRTDVSLEAVQQREADKAEEVRRDSLRSGIVWLGGLSWSDEDILDRGEKVTSRYLKSAPGKGSPWSKLPEHPLLIAVVSAALAVAGTLAATAIQAKLTDSKKAVAASECPPAKQGNSAITQSSSTKLPVQSATSRGTQPPPGT